MFDYLPLSALNVLLVVVLIYYLSDPMSEKKDHVHVVECASGCGGERREIGKAFLYMTF